MRTATDAAETTRREAQLADLLADARERRRLADYGGAAAVLVQLARLSGNLAKRLRRQQAAQLAVQRAAIRARRKAEAH